MKLNLKVMLFFVFVLVVLTVLYKGKKIKEAFFLEEQPLRAFVYMYTSWIREDGRLVSMIVSTQKLSLGELEVKINTLSGEENEITLSAVITSAELTNSNNPRIDIYRNIAEYYWNETYQHFYVHQFTSNDLNSDHPKVHVPGNHHSHLSYLIDISDEYIAPPTTTTETPPTTTETPPTTTTTTLTPTTLTPTTVTFLEDTCTDNPLWRSGFGDCGSYANGHITGNHSFCATDEGTGNIKAEDACPVACDNCPNTQTHTTTTTTETPTTESPTTETPTTTTTTQVPTTTMPVCTDPPEGLRYNSPREGIIYRSCAKAAEIEECCQGGDYANFLPWRCGYYRGDKPYEACHLSCERWKDKGPATNPHNRREYSRRALPPICREPPTTTTPTQGPCTEPNCSKDEYIYGNCDEGPRPICKPCSICNVEQGQYYVSGCSDRQDTECANCTICNDDQVKVDDCDPFNDTVCELENLGNMPKQIKLIFEKDDFELLGRLYNYSTFNKETIFNLELNSTDFDYDTIGKSIKRSDECLGNECMQYLLNNYDYFLRTTGDEFNRRQDVDFDFKNVYKTDNGMDGQPGWLLWNRNKEVWFYVRMLDADKIDNTNISIFNRFRMDSPDNDGWVYDVDWERNKIIEDNTPLDEGGKFRLFKCFRIINRGENNLHPGEIGNAFRIHWIQQGFVGRWSTNQLFNYQKLFINNDSHKFPDSCAENEINEIGDLVFYSQYQVFNKDGDGNYYVDTRVGRDYDMSVEENIRGIFKLQFICEEPSTTQTPTPTPTTQTPTTQTPTTQTPTTPISEYQNFAKVLDGKKFSTWRYSNQVSIEDMKELCSEQCNNDDECKGFQIVNNPKYRNCYLYNDIGTCDGIQSNNKLNYKKQNTVWNCNDDNGNGVIGFKNVLSGKKFSTWSDRWPLEFYSYDNEEKASFINRCKILCNSPSRNQLYGQCKGFQVRTLHNGNMKGYFYTELGKCTGSSTRMDIDNYVKNSATWEHDGKNCNSSPAGYERLLDGRTFTGDGEQANMSEICRVTCNTDDKCKGFQIRRDNNGERIKCYLYEDLGRCRGSSTQMNLDNYVKNSATWEHNNTNCKQ